MKKKLLIISILMAFVVIVLSGCKSQEEKLIGTWYAVDLESKEIVFPEKYVSFYDGGTIDENAGILGDSYGISYKISDGKILFIYYGDVEVSAKFKISGNTLILEAEQGYLPYNVFKKQKN